MPALVAQCEYVQHRSGRRDSCHSVCAIFISHPQLWQHPRRAGPNLLRLFWRVVGSERNWGGTPAGPAVCLCHQLRLGPVHTNSAEMLPWPHGDYRSSVRTHCTSPARSARQRQTVELASAQRDPLCRRAGLQVAGVAAPIRQLAYRLHPDEPLVEEWGARPGV